MITDNNDKTILEYPKNVINVVENSRPAQNFSFKHYISDYLNAEKDGLEYLNNNDNDNNKNTLNISIGIINEIEKKI